MKYSIICLLLFFGFSGETQIDIDRKNVISNPCPSNPDVQIFEYENWEIYQTENDEWDGTRLSNCVNLSEGFIFGTESWGIDLSTVETSKPVFCRFKTEQAVNGILNVDRNMLIHLTAGMLSFELENYNLSDTCTNRLCTGLITILEYAQGLDSGERRTDYNILEDNFGQIFTCFFTEKTALNRFQELIYKLSFSENVDEDELIYPANIQFFPSFTSPTIIDEPEISISDDYLVDDEYDITLYELTDGWAGSGWVLTHNEPGFPAFDNQSITYLNPEVNTNEPTVFNLFIEEFESFHTQAHSHLKGGLVDGSDSIYHELNIFNESIGICEFLIERIFEDNTNLISYGGEYLFSSPSACLQFRKNSKLIVGENANLNYAPDGTGILNLRSGGTIELRENARLNFNGLLMLNTYEKFNGPQDIYIDVPLGTSMIFGPKARIKSKYAPITLNFVMKGGYVDMRNLSEESKSLVNFIYPTPLRLNAEEIFITPNPVKSTLTFQIADSLEKALVSIYNLKGQLIKASDSYCLEATACQVEIDDLQSGAYFIVVEANNKVYRSNFVKID